ncbi:DUF4157 domain-containing protein [Lysobacter sp. BMK333-48F3]|uniref:eCIS core domain-containing protein n=1 Tax=Lysobacter sp. BMK333-48F3 TaxID=2867962 RepID=UPI001C8B694D|nr:DUF4157 domain-containing protein [Lysobacter sp. BMK333-48F3]MBX9403072.1 DUF4157 domain-containing protein [Lysobacter sp. BMK333-48F3]
MVLPQRIDAAPGHEGEADRIADAALQRLSLPAASAPAGAEPLAEAAPIAELGTGRPLTASLRAAFERAFGWEFSGVRVHSDGAAHAAARRLGARAFAFARNLVFGDKVADPEAGEHRHLLAHELTHVVQQDLGAGAAPARSGLSQQVAAAPMLAQAAPLVTNVATSAAELGVGGTDITATATVAGRTTLAWSINPGGVAPAGVSVIGGGRRVRIRAVQPAPGTVVGGAALTIRAAVSGTPADNADSAAVRLVQVTSATYAANPALAAVPSLIPGAAPAGTAEPNRDGINGNSATVNAVTAPGARPVRVTLRRALGARVAGNVITPGAQTGDIRVRITDTATGARLNETQPVAAPVAGASGLMSELTVNAVPTRVSALAFAGGAGPYGVRNRITFQSSDAAHPPLTRIVGELITLNRNDFNLGPVNPPIGFNPAFVLALAVPANAWVDQLVTPTALPNVGDGRPAIDVNRFVGPGVPQLPRFWNFRQRFQYSSWRGAGAVVSRTFADGVHERSLRGSQAAGFQFRTDHRFGGVAAPPRNDPYAGNPLIVFSAVTATPNAAGATALAADGAATARLTVASSVAARSARWNVLSGDVVITAGNPAALPAAATLRAGVQAGRFRLRAADTIFPNRRADGRVRVAAVRLRNMRAAPSPVPVGTLSSVVTLNAEPGGRNIVFTVDPAAAAAGVTVALNANPPGVAVAATVTRPAAFTGVVTVTARDSVLAARTATTRIRFR